ncbi:YaiI/YqxD family protein [Falsiroseomonas sp. HW251]|uniref:YaiI/YqxD family protein n=1 Tax=Falsiroseomonas sp. HW251 TaxID=3390998 RepID=UPI003D323775
MNQTTAPRFLVDADACPVRDEILRVAGRLGFETVLVSNGSRPIRPPGGNTRIVIVTDGADKADDWIAEAATPTDVCLTNDIPLAARCLEKKAFCLSFKGHAWTENNIGSALAGRELSRHLREMGMGGGPAPMAASDKSRFLNALDAMAQSALRAARRG